MERIGVRELRQHASLYLARVRSGEAFEITDRGTLVAVLSPPSPAASARARLLAAGLLVAAAAPGGILPRPVRAARRSDDVLAELREEG